MEEDAGRVLWEGIYQELCRDESVFKARMVMLDEAVKGCHRSGEMAWRSLPPVSAAMVEQIDALAPWNGCKFVTAVVVHLTSSPTDMANKIQAVKPTAGSLGGLALPSQREIAITKRVDTLSVAFARAMSVLEASGASTVIGVSLADMEVLVAARNNAHRRATFPHSFSLTISPAGVYIYQGYGAIGYTLRQYMEKNRAQFPLTHGQGREFVDTFTQLMKSSVDNGGKWTRAVNDLYQSLFDVDLLKLKNMSLKAQFDPFVKVRYYTFTADNVRANFSLLPACPLSHTFCRDHDIASGKLKTNGSGPDGGVKARYTPVFADYPHTNATASTEPHTHDECAHCGIITSELLLVCGQCKKACYCCKLHQQMHWRKEHKLLCLS